MRAAIGRQPKLARARAVEQPGLQDAVLDERKFLALDALAVERTRAQATLAKWIVDDANAVAEQLDPHLVLEEAGLARDRSAVDGAGKMRNERPGHPRIEHHRHLAGRDLARVEPRHRALAGA